ncbi:MAG: hypothetical protein EAZ85_01510 [Bacteroidetes bacterium]|nr:MAG: hypothetical protein EAZ85_01510 [Bacteroidota bacterium]TAG87948.1 MAG: hypothetical protein EAZ20_09560 [Bacteroidota bacterium]
MNNYTNIDDSELSILEESQLQFEAKGFQSIISDDGKQNFERLNTKISNLPIKLESRRYIGNKNKLLDWIKENIDSNTKNCTSFFDVFAGTASVTKVMAKKYEKIVLNDILFSNEVIYKAFFKIGDYNKEKLEQILQNYNQIEIDSLENNYFSDNFGNKFFDIENAKLIGYIREDIENKKNDLTEKEYCILLATLIYNIDKIANTVGHFDAYIKKTIKSIKLHLKMIESLNNLMKN